MRSNCLSLFYLLFLLPVVSSNAFASGVATDPIIYNSSIVVDKYDLDAVLDEGSATAQYQVLKNDVRIKQLLEQLFISRAAAFKAEQQGLASRPEVQAKLKRARERILLGLLIEEVDAQPVPDMTDAAREHYKAYPEKYMVGEKVKASHILIRTKALPGEKEAPHTTEEAFNIAKDVLKEIKKGSDFYNLAKKYSEDPSARKNHGDLGWFGRNTMLRPFENTVFSMQNPGDISDIVETSLGFHIIRLDDKDAGSLQSFVEVKDDIVNVLVKEYKASRRKDYIDSLKAEAAPVIDDVNLSNYIDSKLDSISALKELRDKSSK